MSLGLSIVISTAMVVCALMYRWTRDRWAWRRIALVLGAAITLVSVVLGGIVVWHWDQHRPKPLTTYMGVTLGDSKKLVIYKRGPPSDVDDDPPPYAPGYNPFEHMYSVNWSLDHLGIPIPDGRSYMSYNSWSWDLEKESNDMGEGLIQIGFDKKSGDVDQIGCFVTKPKYKSCAAELGIESGTNEDSVRRILGNPNTECVRGTVKIWWFKRYNLRLNFYKGVVSRVFVTKLQDDTHDLFSYEEKSE